jgi:shikimate dehydrogenase
MTSQAAPLDAPPGPALCGIILHPAGHTLSPAMHAAAYRALGIDAVYVAFDVAPIALRDAVAGMRALGIRQLSVSLPHKEAVLALADQVSSEARAIGAANTLTRVGGELVADNTDASGVRRTLEPRGPWPGKRATVLGAGGAARAVVHALCALGLEVAIVNRTRARAERLAAELGGRVGTLDDAYDLLVNATPVGMHPRSDETPVPAGRLLPGATVFDTVYRPLETRLLREARERGCRTQDGLEMLVQQAALQIRIWSGRDADPRVLRGAAEAALQATGPTGSGAAPRARGGRSGRRR